MESRGSSAKWAPATGADSTPSIPCAASVSRETRPSDAESGAADSRASESSSTGSVAALPAVTPRSTVSTGTAAGEVAPGPMASPLLSAALGAGGISAPSPPAQSSTSLTH
ncbi:hypothetical protein GCM10020000_40350 [Streptomyces olivoverticillatus]